MRISWNDLGRPEKAGSFPFGDGFANVRPREIRIWKEHPDASFLATPFQPRSGPVQFVLSTYTSGKTSDEGVPPDRLSAENDV